MDDVTRENNLVGLEELYNPGGSVDGFFNPTLIRGARTPAVAGPQTNEVTSSDFGFVFCRSCC